MLGIELGLTVCKANVLPLSYHSGPWNSFLFFGCHSSGQKLEGHFKRFSAPLYGLHSSMLGSGTVVPGYIQQWLGWQAVLGIRFRPSLYQACALPLSAISLIREILQILSYLIKSWLVILFLGFLEADMYGTTLLELMYGSFKMEKLHSF